ncbi:hypothetical protein C1T17_03380 [Sphingobium sp. SCG-1]|uniref:hypothetical protein n=1 Tax=Sphingobium sp. SCG-1 TaxID=2072936 RepID=UPI000CD68081|nr:hypothetical protein [Sphingobium sp. SCG-1]AUW57273.1 hypothetical protein C1T17_03380 [Sphingobium sp. SCG-1]
MAPFTGVGLNGWFIAESCGPLIDGAAVNVFGEKRRPRGPRSGRSPSARHLQIGDVSENL